MKKLVFALTALVATSFPMWSYEYPEGYVTVDNIKYECNRNGKADVAGYEGEPKDVIIPASVNYEGIEYTVTEVSSGSFYECSSLTSITLPPTIIDIDNGAFGGCTNLKEVTFEGDGAKRDLCISCTIAYDTETIMEVSAFNNCPSLSKIVVGRVIKPNYTYLEKKIVYGIFADSPIKEIVFTADATAIGEQSFAGIASLEKISIPSTVNLIMPNAFMDCENLKNVTLEESSDPLFMIGDFGKSGIEVLNLNRQLFEGTIEVGSFGTYNCKPTFAGCSGLTTINFGENVSSISDNMFADCTALRSVTIPQSISNIGEGAFSGCMNLKSINIEDCDKLILINSKTVNGGEGSTFATAPLETIYLGRNVEFSGTELSPFKNKTMLSTLTIGNKVTDINDFLFYGCANIEMLAVPSSVKRVGNYAFYDCQNSKSLMISASVETIGEYAFYNCKELSKISIPKSVKEIGDYAFRNCNKAASITLGNALTTIGDYAFLDCYGAKTITFGGSVKTIGKNAFYNCSACEEFVLPNSLESIGDDAFAMCTGAKEVNTGDGLKTIGMRAFADCESLAKVTISPKIESIGDFAFFNCENISEINVKAVTPPVAYESAFSNYGSALYVPAGAAAAYKGAADYCWPLFSSISEKDFAAGIGAVEVNAGETMYFTLQGVRVSDKELAPGIYVKVCGGKTQKVLVK